MRLAEISEMPLYPPPVQRQAATREVVQAYFRAWTTGDALGVATVLAADARLTAPIPVSWPRGVAVRLVSEVVDGEEAIQIYEAATANKRRVRVWERLLVENGQIVAVEMMFDVAAMNRFMGSR